MTVLSVDEMRCPRCGEISGTPDICSECGSSMVPSVPVATVLPATVTADIPSTPNAPPADTVERVCPECGEPRAGLHDRYCGTCRYDYISKTPFSAPVPQAAPVSQAAGSVSAADVPVTPVQAPHVPLVPVSGSMPTRLLRWEITVVSDPGLCAPGDDRPSDLRERRFPVDFDENMIGREGRGGNPEITVSDPGISRRHARVDRKSDGTLFLTDMGSTNGTRLNGTEIDPHIAYPLSDGDEITVGVFTRMTVRGR